MKTHRRIDDALGEREDKPFKATLFEGDQLMLGVNVLLPGQEQAVHVHRDQDKFYLVQSGEGLFEVGDERFPASAGTVIWAPKGVEHGVRNEARDERLVVLVGMAPPPPPKA